MKIVDTKKDNQIISTRKEPIIISLDLNRKGNNSDVFYLKEDLVPLGFGSNDLKSLTQEEQTKILENKADLFQIEVNNYFSNKELTSHNQKSWLTPEIYNAKDKNIIIGYSTENENALVTAKLNKAAFNYLASASNLYIDELAININNYLNKSNKNSTVAKIFKALQNAITTQRNDNNNRDNKVVVAMQQQGIRELFYHNKCATGNYTTLHAYLNQNTIHYNYTSLNEVIETTKLSLKDEPFVVYNEKGKWYKSELEVDFLYNKGNCPQDHNFSEEEQKDFEQKILDFLKIAAKKGNERTLALIEKKLKKHFENPFYQTVNLAVNIETYPNDYNRTLQATSFDNIQLMKNQFNRIKKTSFSRGVTPDITINFVIDEKGNITITNKVNPNYLKQFEEKWVKEAKKRGLQVNIPALRSQVHRDIENLAKANEEISFYKKFINELETLVSDKVVNYVKAIDATQKIATNVWDQGTINESTWHTTEEFAAENKQWPQYCQLPPVIAGVEDGVIDEIIGIPMAIKGIYEIIVDEQKQDALKAMFTKDGMVNLYEGLKTEVKDTYNDPEKGEHFAGQTTVSVITMMTGAGLFSKVKKLDEVVETTTDLEKVIPDAKTTKFLENTRKAERHVDTDKAIKELTEEVGSERLSEAVEELTDLTENAAKNGKKFTWQEIKAFFKRGNDFNKKIRDLEPNPYQFHEVTVEQIIDGKLKKFRLDSYNEGLEIVSRKATDFDNIKLSTFEGYLKELKKKYPEGAKITAPKYGNQLEGKVLKGKLKLEVPESNRLSSKLKEFEELAKKYNVEIKFQAE